MLNSKVAGEPVQKIRTKDLSVALERMLLMSLGDSEISDEYASVDFPSLKSMGFDNNNTAQYEAIDKTVSSLLLLLFSYSKNYFDQRRSDIHSYSLVVMSC